MKIRATLLAGLSIACVSSVAHAADSPKLAQIKALVSDYRQKSSGPFAGFSGVYDLFKSCEHLEHPDAPEGAMWLLAKYVMWFEGDQLLYGELVRPTNIDRGTLKFKRDYALSPGQTIKVYDLKWNVGAPDIVAFLADRELFGGKFIGSKFNFDYAMRCNNEDQIIGSTEEILRLMGL